MAAPPPPPPPPPGLVVLASARAWVPLPPPALPLPSASGSSPSPSPSPSSPFSGREWQPPRRRLLRLQLSAAPGPERFRLGLRGGPDSGPEPCLVEYSLKEISYEVKTATCHELKVLARPDDPLVFHFEDEQEAQKWWSVVSSSIREIQKAAENTNILTGRLLPYPSAAMNSLPVSKPEASLTSQLARKEELALHLSAAVELGDEAEAVRWATVLAQLRTPLRVLLKESCYPTSEISMKVQVEDAECSASIIIRVHTYTTIAALRQQVFQHYGFHPTVQRWIIGQCLCVDDRTVGSYGIRKDGDTAFLYLLSAKGASLSEQRYKEDKDWVVLQVAPSPLANTSETQRKYSTLPNPPTKKGMKDGNKKMDIGEISQFLGSLQLGNLHPGHAQAPQATTAAPPSPVPDGWSCPTCTFINKPTRPGCEMCSTDRPADYVIPGSYKPDETELWRMQQEKEGILQYQKEKGRREDGSTGPCANNFASLDDFIHLSSDFS